MVNPLEQIKTNIDNAIYGYDPSEFMPIRVDGEVANWDAFIAYKAKRVAQAAGRATLHVVQGVAAAIEQAQTQ